LDLTPAVVQGACVYVGDATNLYTVFVLSVGRSRDTPTVFRKGYSELLDLIGQYKGRVMLSGYPSGLYDRRLGDWARDEFDLSN
jgi:hypothetical protein